jgi:hypothetical protein
MLRVEGVYALLMKEREALLDRLDSMVRNTYV